MSELFTRDKDPTCPLNDTVLILAVERIDRKPPRRLPFGMVAWAKNVSFSFEKVISISPKDFSIFQLVWSIIENRHGGVNQGLIRKEQHSHNANVSLRSRIPSNILWSQPTHSHQLILIKPGPTTSCTRPLCCTLPWARPIIHASSLMDRACSSQDVERPYKS